MITGLELDTSSSSSTPTINTTTTTTTTTTTSSSSTSVRMGLPSFDALLKSIGYEAASHPHHPHHMHHMHAHHHGVAAPYPTHSHGSHHLHESIHRPPSTPPTPSVLTDHHTSHSGVHHHSHAHGRPRSNSVPSISRTHLTSPFKGDHCLVDDHSTEHYADRVRALKDGDGEWNTWSLNAVVPVSLPYHARPHIHPRASTGSIPLTPATAPAPALATASMKNIIHPHSPSHSPLHQHPDRSIGTYFPPILPINTVTSPIPILRPVPRRSPSFGSHSPLSVNAPLTPQSLRGIDENENEEGDVEMKSNSRLSTPTPLSDRQSGMTLTSTSLPRIYRGL
ncbi:hypothetical protein CI109_100616 [Kwoniella shandongensis]|uniref:Uncharacterized protein n=1 Tax=Kwoniella shandongensis TaxID=1734106 RepID=A0A5M6BZK4_9TREE|nr:uncharacterized protein CI109_003462 [Kwoniella shandongensis]KAA5528173.1 hypothetical protein CI109_003462 [Kwoniella shandongensis]